MNPLPRKGLLEKGGAGFCCVYEMNGHKETEWCGTLGICNTTISNMDAERHGQQVRYMNSAFKWLVTKVNKVRWITNTTALLSGCDTRCMRTVRGKKCNLSHVTYGSTFSVTP